MPFGVGSCEDSQVLDKSSQIQNMSPMPFGVGSCEDKHP